ncbi:hypothetical protein EMCRGX_G023423 [Ephydatia muelleri]
MVAGFEKVWQDSYDEKSAEELKRKAAIKLVNTTATPPVQTALQLTGSPTPDDDVEDISAESVVDSNVSKVIDGNDATKKVKARAQRSILWNVNVMKPIRDKFGICGHGITSNWEMKTVLLAASPCGHERHTAHSAELGLELDDSGKRSYSLLRDMLPPLETLVVTVQGSDGSDGVSSVLIPNRLLEEWANARSTKEGLRPIGLKLGKHTYIK